jgi:hypothetical protein
VDIAYSVKEVPIRLTYERWFHITENHDDLASYYFEVLETNGWSLFIENFRKQMALLSQHIFWIKDQKEM